MNSNNTFFLMNINKELQIEESTPLKSDVQYSLNLNISPIRKRLSLNTTLEDIDSAYYSKLKGSSPSIHSIRSPSITSIRSPSKFTKKFPNWIDSLNLSHPNEENDFLSRLFERNIFHILRKILDYLKPSDYARMLTVCKKWHRIVSDDLNYNLKRKIQINQLKRDFLAKKENVNFSRLLNNSIGEIINYTNLVSFEYRECILSKLESNSRLREFSPENTKQTHGKKSLIICSCKNRKNLKRL